MRKIFHDMHYVKEIFLNLIDFIHCNSDVVSFLLCEMEDLFIHTQKETDLIDYHCQTSASNFDYGDMDVDINISININDHEDLVRSTTAKFLLNVRRYWLMWNDYCSESNTVIIIRVILH
jgi:hypothetical protein